MLNDLEREVCEYFPLAGENIADAIKNAKELAKRESFRRKRHIRCIANFNDIIMDVSEFSDNKERLEFFNSELKRHSEEYHQSDEYMLREEERRRELMNEQEHVDSLMKEFDRISKGPFFSREILITWFMKFAQVTDRIGLQYNRNKIVNYLQEHGCKRGAYLNMPQEDYKDPGIMAGYIFGQIIDMLLGPVGCIHPVFMEKMGSEYLSTVNNK